MWTALPSAKESANDPLRTGILRFSPRTLAVALPTHRMENEPVDATFSCRTGEYVEVAALPLHHRLRRPTMPPPRRDEGSVEDRGECLDLPVRRPDRRPRARVARLPQRVLGPARPAEASG